MYLTGQVVLLKFDCEIPSYSRLQTSVNQNRVTIPLGWAFLGFRSQKIISLRSPLSVPLPLYTLSHSLFISCHVTRVSIFSWALFNGGFEACRSKLLFFYIYLSASPPKIFLSKLNWNDLFALPTMLYFQAPSILVYPFLTFFTPT